MNRRNFLHGIGGVALALPFLESGFGRVHAAPTPGARRLAVLFNMSGVNMAQFAPKGEFGMLASGHLSGDCTLAPLAPFADRLNVVRGIYTGPGIGGSSVFHDDAIAKSLTAMARSGELGGGISVDQEAAKSLNVGTTRRSPLLLACGQDGSAYGAQGVISYVAAGQPVASENNPRRALGDLGLSSADEVTQALVASRRMSVIDLVSEEARLLTGRNISASDREKLDRHFTLLRESEQAAGALCSVAPHVQSGLDAFDDSRAGEDGQYANTVKLQMNILAMSLACGISNVGSLMYAPGSGGPVITWDGLNLPRNPHGTSHGVSGEAFADVADPEAMTRIAQIDRWFFTQMNYFLELLDGYQEADGTVLDNSAILSINEMSDGGTHSTNDLPILIAGGAGGALATGRYVNVGSKNPEPYYENGIYKGDLISGDGCVPQSQLFTTLLNAVGATNEAGQAHDRFGDASLPGGALGVLQA